LKLKQRPTDFKVSELLRDGVIVGRGEHRVYRVTKTKRTSLDAARVLGELTGVAPGAVAMAGLKDRQGVTQQYMSVFRGKDVRVKQPELGIEPVGFAEQELTSDDSEGNRFEVVVRDLGEGELRRLRAGLDAVRTFGLPNYFDEQRFGNLRHGQGWIALDLLRGKPDEALKRLLASVSKFEPKDSRHFKELLWRKWGDWRACRELAGRIGKHHSVFEHLRKNEGDFAGAFKRVSARERLIHLYAFQSHLWNRAVVRWLDRVLQPRDRFGLRALEGKLVFPRGAMPVEEGWGGRFPLAGAQLAGIDDPFQRRLYEEVLGRHELTPEAFHTDVPGFGLKHEDRPLAVVPAELRVRPAEPDKLNAGRHMVRMSFGLPRGAYATLVVRRLIGPAKH
jgi:tRNA pseudouridine13 synthase